MTQTPLRVSFFGGGTDYPEHFLKHGGAVLGTAIDKFSYITASPFPSRLFDYAVRVSYRKVELVKSVGEIEHNVYRECLKYCGLERDIELHNVADLPSFTGLGSSSTFTVGLLQALHAFQGKKVDGVELAYQAIHIERNILNENVGCQDQTFAAAGGFNVVEFHAEDDIRVLPLSIDATRIKDLEDHLFIVFTGQTRRAHDVVAGQLERVNDNKDTLLSMRKMVDKAHDILTGDGSVLPFGELLHEAWQAKRSLSPDVSNPTIDALYQEALDCGAVGGKLLGAGGGGFLLVVAPPEKHDTLRKAFADLEEIDIHVNAPGARVVFDPS
jgi:D-glycero-alpha-D-manno-heptose-7-phosphate kinase